MDDDAFPLHFSEPNVLAFTEMADFGEKFRAHLVECQLLFQIFGDIAVFEPEPIQFLP